MVVRAVTVLALWVGFTGIAFAAPIEVAKIKEAEAVKELFKENKELRDKVDKLVELANGKKPLTKLEVDALKKIEEECLKDAKSGKDIFRSFYGAIRAKSSFSAAATATLDTGLLKYEPGDDISRGSPALLKVMERTADVTSGAQPVSTSYTKPVSKVETRKATDGVLNKFQEAAEKFGPNHPAGDKGAQVKRRGRIKDAVNQAEEGDRKTDPNKPADLPEATLQQRVQRQRASKAVRHNDESSPKAIDAMLGKTKDGTYPPGTERAVRGMEYVEEIIDGGMTRALTRTKKEIEREVQDLKAEMKKLQGDKNTNPETLKALTAQLKSLESMAELAGRKVTVTIDGKDKETTIGEALRADPTLLEIVKELDQKQKEIDDLTEQRRKAIDPAEQLALEQQITERILARAQILDALFNSPALLENKSLTAALDLFREAAEFELGKALEGRLMQVLENDPRFRGEAKLEERRREAKDTLCTRCKDAVPPIGGYCATKAGATKPNGAPTHRTAK